MHEEEVMCVCGGGRVRVLVGTRAAGSMAFAPAMPACRHASSVLNGVGVVIVVAWALFAWTS